MQTADILVAIGALLLLGLLTDALGRRTRLPRVTLLILFGVAAGPGGFDWLPAEVLDWRDILTSTALTMVAFLLGGKLTGKALRAHGRAILAISLAVVLVTASIVGFGLLLLGVPLAMALLLAAISTSTAPAATQDVVRQSGARGPFTDTLLGIVAVDDAWGLIVFSLALTVVAMLAGTDAGDALTTGLLEIGGALLVGLAIGLPAAALTGRLRRGEPILSEALIVVFLGAGLAMQIGASFLLAGMIAGAVIANLAHHHSRPFHEIEHIEWPFMVFFFVLAGASLSADDVLDLGWIGIAYLAFRLLGRFAGAWLGAGIAQVPRAHRQWMGCALVPQAGVAIGMALVAGQHVPDLAEPILAVTVGTAVMFEIFGPILTQQALQRVGETLTHR